jgi:ABC-type multidrug transport system ATPase subunit
MQEAQQCDRLLLMSGGRLIAAGSEADIVGSTHAVAVHTDDWSRAFAVLNEAGLPVMLAGRSVRVADGDPDDVDRLLAASGVTATVEAMPGTMEERMLVLARGTALDS